ncbi:hypothetical protein KHP62_16410 [Rhodobacteraceae bacterium NNCM2]|nr:hypothetical protein [Coraliihabitans acroporae]
MIGVNGASFAEYHLNELLGVLGGKSGAENQILYQPANLVREYGCDGFGDLLGRWFEFYFLDNLMNDSDGRYQPINVNRCGHRYEIAIEQTGIGYRVKPGNVFETIRPVLHFRPNSVVQLLHQGARQLLQGKHQATPPGGTKVLVGPRIGDSVGHKSSNYKMRGPIPAFRSARTKWITIGGFLESLLIFLNAF